MGKRDSIVLFSESMRTVLDDVQLGIWVGTLCLPGIIQLHDTVLGSMDDRYRTPVGFDLHKRCPPDCCI